MNNLILTLLLQADATPFTSEGFLSLLNRHIDWIAVLVVIAGGIISKKMLGGLKQVCIGGRTFKLGNTTKTLIFGTLFITLYIIVLGASGQLHREDYTKYFLSYCFATSLYDIILKNLFKVIGIEETEK